MKKMCSLDDYKHKLIDKILGSDSFEQIKRYLLTAINSFDKNKVNEHLVGRFIDKTLNQLQRLNSTDLELKQAQNVRYAKLQLEIFRAKRAGTTGKYVPS